MTQEFTDSPVLGKYVGEKRSLDQIIADLPRRGQVAKILGMCEGICNSGILGDDLTKKLRGEIAATLAAFNMPTESDFDRNLNAIREVMESSK